MFVQIEAAAADAKAAHSRLVEYFAAQAQASKDQHNVHEAASTASAPATVAQAVESKVTII